jgi:hypothetical protein
MYNLRSYTHGQLRLEHAKLAIAEGVVSRNGWKTKVPVLLISTCLARAMQGARLIGKSESMIFATTFTGFTDAAARAMMVLQYNIISVL